MVPTTELDRAVTERLSANDLRYTSGRRMIVSVLRKADGPVTLPELLQLAGIVRRLVHGGDHAHFELAEELTEHHHHLICEACGSVQDFTLDAGLEVALDETFSRIASSAGATVTGHTVDLFVTCRDCS